MCCHATTFLYDGKFQVLSRYKNIDVKKSLTLPHKTIIIVTIYSFKWSKY